VPNLPDDLITCAAELLVPLMTTVDERDVCLTEAFYITDRRLYSSIEREGAPRVFTNKLIKILLDRGCSDGDVHALTRILTVTRPDMGADRGAKAADLCTLLDDTCAETTPPPVTEVTAPPTPIDVPGATLSYATPPEKRTPTVFLSYSRSNTEFVSSLRKDLVATGHSVSSDIPGSEDWVRAISEGINNSYAFVSVVSEAANASKWVKREHLWADDKNKPIYPVIIEACDLPFYLVDRQAISFMTDYAVGLTRLLASLPAPRVAVEGVRDSAPVIEIPAPDRRAVELEYLDRLHIEEWLIRVDKYTPMGGSAQITDARHIGEPVGIRPEFEHLRQRVQNDFGGRETENRTFSDILDAIREMRRLVLLGEPSMGKSTTLWRLACSSSDSLCRFKL
jgi:hypothetical protein